MAHPYHNERDLPVDDELKKKLIGYLDAIEKATTKATDFAAAEIPEAIREWLTWLAIERFSYAAGFLVLSGLLLAAARYLWRAMKDDEWDSDMRAFTWIMCALLSLCSLAGSLKNALSGVKVIVAPRVVLIEEVANLVKSKK